MMSVIYTGISNSDFIQGEVYEISDIWRVKSEVFIFAFGNNGEEELLIPSEYIRVNDKIRWRKVLKAKGYKRDKSKVFYTEFYKKNKKYVITRYEGFHFIKRKFVWRKIRSSGEYILNEVNRLERDE